MDNDFDSLDEFDVFFTDCKHITEYRILNLFLLLLKVFLNVE